MAISLLQTSTRATGAAPAQFAASSFSSTPTVGNWVIAICTAGFGSYGTAPTGWTVTDNQGNTYTSRAAATADGNRIGVFTAPITTASGTFTTTATFTGAGVDSDQGLTLLEVSILDAGSLVDLLVQLSSDSSYGTNFNVTTAATDSSDEIVIAVVAVRGNGSLSGSPSPSVPPTNYTTIFNVTSGLGCGYAAYRITTTTGAQSINLSGLPTEGQPGMVVVSFRGGTAGPPPQVLVPDADITDGAWTPSTGSDLYAVLDETPASDTDYIVTSSNSECEIGLQNGTTPDAGAQTFRYRALGSAAKALVAGIYDGTTLIEEWTTDPLPAAATLYTRTLGTPMSSLADPRIRFETINAASPPSPTVTFQSIGTGANGSTSVAPSYPASIAAGDYLVCVVTSGATNSETPTTPSGWTLLATGASTDGTYGVDTGPRRATVFGKVADGTESGTLSVSITNGGTCRGTISRFTKSQAGYTWDVVGAGGNDSTSGTGFSASVGSVNWATGDAALVAVGQRVDTVTQSAQSLTASGTTFGTRTNRATTAVTTGNDHRHVVDTFAAVTTGGGSATTTWAYTGSGATSGGVVVVRLREIPPTEFARVTWAEFEAPDGAGGFSQAYGRSDETDTALALARSKARAAGLSAETDAALATGRRKSRAVGVAVETNTAFAPARVKSRAFGRADELDTAFALGSADTQAYGRADETDAAFALGRVKSRATGIALETDAALALTGRKARAAGVALETDAAFALGRRKSRAVQLAAETDTALAPGRSKARAAGLAAETDAAFSTGRVKLRPYGLASEVDTAFALPPQGVMSQAYGRADEIDTAFALSAVVAGAGQGFGSYAPRRRNKRVLQQERDRILARNAPQPAPPPPVFDPGPVIIHVPRHVVAAQPAPPKPTVQYVLFKHEVERDVFVYLPRAEPLQQPEPPKVVPKKPPPKLAAPPALMRSHGLTLMRTATK